MEGEDEHHQDTQVQEQDDSQAQLVCNHNLGDEAEDLHRGEELECSHTHVQEAPSCGEEHHGVGLQGGRGWEWEQHRGCDDEVVEDDGGQDIEVKDPCHLRTVPYHKLLAASRDHQSRNKEIINIIF